MLKKDDDIRKGTDSYIDDIVDKTAVPESNLVSHHKFGLTVKLPKSLGGGAALGLQLD